MTAHQRRLLALGPQPRYPLLAQVAHGAGSAFFYPAMDALVPEVVESEHKKKANALRKMAESLGWIVGPAICAGILVVGGPGWAFAVDAATFLASALLIKGLATPFASPAELPGEESGPECGDEDGRGSQAGDERSSLGPADRALDPAGWAGQHRLAFLEPAQVIGKRASGEVAAVRFLG